MAVLRSVAKTDTFEKQRQIINQIASDVYNFSVGGTDLSTGNLKLGDGSKDTPSLSFINDESLGLFRPDSNTVTFVSNSKRIFGYDDTSAIYYRNFILQKNELITDGLEIQSEGQNYDPGDYSDISVIGGTGSNGSIDITISPYSGTATPGSGYVYSGDSLGTQQYSNVVLTGGAGTGATVNLLFNGGSFESTEIVSYGTDYVLGDILTLPPDKTGITGTITEDDTNITVSSTDGIYPGWAVVRTSGTGTLNTPTDINGNPVAITVSNVIDETTIALNTTGATSGSGTFNFLAPWGSSGSGYQFLITKLGILTDLSVSSSGNGYTIGDILSLNPLDLTQYIDYVVNTINVQIVTFTTSVSSTAISIGDSIESLDSNAPVGGGGGLQNLGTILEVSTSGGIITSVTVQMSAGSVSSGHDFIVNGGASYSVDTAESASRYTIDTNDGSGPQIYPDLLLYKDNKYRFDISAVASQHPFTFSTFRDGSNNSIEKTVTLSDSSNNITVSDPSGILLGMSVVTNNTDVSQSGALQQDTFVEAINGTTITLSKTPSSTGTSVLKFSGFEYTSSEIEITSSYLIFQPSDTTPQTLYYYCTQHPDMGGNNNNEAVVTIDYNNPKTFGSGIEILVSDVLSTDVITGDVASGNFNVQQITGTSVNVDTITSENIEATTLLESPKVSTDTLTLEKNADGSDLTTITAIAGRIQLNGSSFIHGPNFTVTAETGSLTTNGILKTTNKINVNDILSIENNIISATTGNGIILTPAALRVVKVNSTSAIVIPSGNSSQRPGVGQVENGAIRFNTETNQYEGYSSSTNSWSSLGGVRDLDGNTYIAAEAFTGANDNILYFYNDDLNTLQVNRNYLDFRTVKKVKSSNLGAPAFVTYTTNTPVTAGQYLKYRNNIYEVITGGVTATSGNEPTDTTGNTFVNGTATLAYFTTAVAPLTFEECSEVRIGPLGDTPLVVSSELRFLRNVFSSDVNDIVIRPNSGKKVTVDATSSFVIPVGDNNQRGAPIAGSIRYNTSISQFEGYSGANWSSLGGVRDVDGNTYIIPETSAGSNENILYFYNNNSNTLRVTENELQFDVVDTITSATSSFLNFNVETITIDNNSLTIDHTDLLSTYVYTTRENLDIGMSTGLTVDKFLRLDVNGNISYNTSFGSGGESFLTLVSGDLKNIEFSDVRISTTTIILERGTIDNGSALCYLSGSEKGAKVLVTAYNENTGHKEQVEFSVIDNGVDISYIDYGNVKTGEELISASFDFNASNAVRLNLLLNSALSLGDSVNITVTSYINK